MIVVVIPVLNRPERVRPLLASLEDGRGEIPYRALFVASPGDRRERIALQSAGAEFIVVSWIAGAGDWAKKINFAVGETTEPWIFTGADDLSFRPGWADVALECARLTESAVVGTNDLGNARVMRGEHATHSLVARAYVEQFGTIDEPGRMLHEGYDHNFVDNELVATAKSRDAFTFCGESVVEHLHPDWRKARTDRTYAKGKAKFAVDRMLFHRRSRLWDGRSASETRGKERLAERRSAARAHRGQ